MLHWKVDQQVFLLYKEANGYNGTLKKISGNIELKDKLITVKF